MINSIHASKLARPMVCAGSLFFKDLPQDPPNDAAKEGTAAGEYLERLLLGKEDVQTHARNGVAFDDDMKFFASQIAEQVEAMRTSAVLCEQDISWQTRSGIWIKGKYDLSFTKDGVLYVDDYKYGWGLVEVKENWQLLAYAIGEVIRRNVAFTHVVVRIHQPRPHHEDGPTREWRLTYHELLGYKEKIETRMDQIVDGRNDLQSGPQCKYCPAAAEACPAFNKSFYRGVELAHDFLQDAIDEHELSFQLDLTTTVLEMMKTKKQSLENLAVHRIKNGVIIPNYASCNRLGDRKWKAGISPEVVKLMTGKDIIEQTMVSPAKAEKMGVPKELVATMVDRPVLGQTLKRVDTSEMGNKIFGRPT